MKRNSESGFILPIVIGVVALGATIGLWYSVDQEKSKVRDISQIEQDAAELYVASQLGVSVNKISFVSGNPTHAKFEYKETENPIFAQRKSSLWKVVEPNSKGYSCEQLEIRGFTGKFLYDCEIQYKEESALTLLTDAQDEAILVGFLNKIDDCAGCVTLTTNTQDKVTFVLDEDFDDGDYVAVNVPDDEIIAINDEPQDTPAGNDNTSSDDELEDQESSDNNDQDDNSASDEEEDDSSDTDSNSENDDQTAQDDSSDSDAPEDETSDDEGATIVEEIVDAEDVDEGPGESDDLDETEVEMDDESSEEGDSTEDEEDESSEEEESSDETSDDPEDEEEEDGYENINFFDLDSSDQVIQVIGDPSEDRQ